METSQIKFTEQEAKDKWCAAFLSCYKKDIEPNREKILLQYKGRLGSEYFSDLVGNPRLYKSRTLTLFGLFSIDNTGEFKDWCDRILKFMKDNLIKSQKYNQKFTAEAISKKLKIPELNVRVCLRVLCYDTNFFVGSDRIPKGEIGLPFVETGNSKILEYDSMETLLKKNEESFLNEKEEDKSSLIYSTEYYSTEKIGRDIFNIFGDFHTVYNKTKEEFKKYPAEFLKETEGHKRKFYYLEKSILQQILSDKKPLNAEEIMRQVFPS